MGQCLNCKIEIQEYTGRRPKKYCSDACRQKFFQTKNKTKSAKKEEKEPPAAKTTNPSLQSSENEFMGVPIPEGLAGIKLAVWKNDIKLGKKKK
jgi:hypothetical protein